MSARTVRAALVPSEVFITNKGPYLLWPRGDAHDAAYMVGVLSSLPLDWYARRFVEVNLNFFLFNPLPVPRPLPQAALRRRIIDLAGRMASPDERFASWAKEVGVAYGPLAPDEKEDGIHEIDAVVLRADPRLRGRGHWRLTGRDLRRRAGGASDSCRRRVPGR